MKYVGITKTQLHNYLQDFTSKYIVMVERSIPLNTHYQTLTSSCRHSKQQCWIESNNLLLQRSEQTQEITAAQGPIQTQQNKVVDQWIHAIIVILSVYNSPAKKIGLAIFTTLLFYLLCELYQFRC